MMGDINVVGELNLNQSSRPIETIIEKCLLCSLNSLLIFINKMHNVTAIKDKVLLLIELIFCAYFTKIIKLALA